MFDGGTGNGMRVHCHVAWGHVTTLGVTLKVSLNCINLLCFGSFAGARAHHQGLRRLKPCQFQRTVYWHCECDKLCSNARFELLAVCCSWTRMQWGHILAAWFLLLIKRELIELLFAFFFPHFLFTLEAEEVFFNFDALNKELS